MEQNRENDEQSVIAAFAVGKISASSGEEVEATLFLGNRGSQTRNIQVILLGIPDEWVVTPAIRTTRLEANQQLSIPFTIETVSTTGQNKTYAVTARVLDMDSGNILAAPTVDLILSGAIQSSNLIIELTEEEIVIAPGASSTIQFRATNIGQQADHFEFSIHGIPAAWVSSEMPVLYLEAGENRELSFEVQLPRAPQIREGSHPVTIRSTPQGARQDTSDVTFTLTVAAFLTSGRIGVRAESVQYTVAPGSITTVSFTLFNQGLEVDDFQLGIDGIPVAWVSTTTAVSRLDPGEQKRVSLTIRPPLSPESQAGRHKFNVKIISRRVPDEMVEMPCILTVAAFHKFNSTLEPQQLEPKETARVTIANQGNIRQNYKLQWNSEDDALEFTAVPETIDPAGPATSSPRPEPVALPNRLQISPGKTGSVSFNVTMRQRPLIGRDVNMPFTIDVSSDEEVQYHNGILNGKPLIPVWVASLFLILSLVLSCTAAFLFNRNNNLTENATATAVAQATAVVGATETAIFNQTRAAELGQEDTDGDGLFNNRELEVGTDPVNPDTDADGLLDGDEVLTRMTDPLNPDSDGDTLNDGQEVQSGTNPLNPDSDSDTLLDNLELLEYSTNPNSADTDNDQLVDAPEVSGCTDPLDPDTDGDGIIDGVDLDPCNSNNPSLTATAEGLVPTLTPPGTTAPATIEPAPTETPPPGVATLPADLPTQVPVVDLPGSIVFNSDRDGFMEVYSSNDPTGVAVTRLTLSASQDVQPAWSPDGERIAFVSNRDGNAEIYIMDADGSNLTRLTNDLAEDVDPSWSPDGDWIAFSSDRDGNEEIYIVRTDGSDLENLSNNPASERDPSWFRASEGLLSSTDFILFTTDRDGNEEIYQMETNGDNPINLTNNPAADNSPAGLSAGGDVSNDPERRILFVSNRDGTSDIFVMDLEGTNPANLTVNPAADTQPTWSPNGEWIAFVSDRLSGNLEIFIIPTDDASAPVINLTNNPANDQYPAWQ